MSGKNVEVVRGVRTRIVVPRRDRRRTLDERILVRFPGLARIVASAWSRLPPRSPIRRAFLARILRQGCEAANRRDFDFLFVLFDPEVEFEFDGSAGSSYAFPDMLGVHRGHEAYRRVWAAGDEAWSDLRLEIEQVIDFGDRLISTGRVTGSGRHTGIELNEPISQLFTMRRGLVISQQDFGDRKRALEAAGLSE
jgi:ketosteroid isomerase-like protein